MQKFFVLGDTGNLDTCYGYQCTLSAYKAADIDPLLLLEQELSFLCALSCANLMTCPLDVGGGDDSADVVSPLVQRHGSLLRKGIAECYKRKKQFLFKDYTCRMCQQCGKRWRYHCRHK